MVKIVRKTVFYKAFKDYFKIFRICLFFPYSCSNKHYFRVLYILRSVYVLYMTTLLSYRIYLESSKKFNKLNEVTNLALSFTDFLTILVYVIHSDSTREVQAQIVQTFNQIDVLMREKLQIEIDYEVQKREINKGLSVSILVILVTLILALVRDYIKKKKFLLVILQKINVNFVFGKCLQYFFYINLLKIRLTLMQERLQKLLVIQDVQPICIKEHAKYDKNRVIFKQILTTKQVYGYLWEITNTLNNCFGLSLLVIVSVYFIQIVCK